MAQVWGLAALAGMLAGCGSQRSIVPDNQLQSDLDAVRRVRIYFGHQSVGRNILDGVERLSQQAKAPVTIVAVGSNPAADAWFAESYLGRNGEPASKCDAFREELDRLDGRVDIALMKFCFVDFDGEIQPGDVFQKYSSTIEGLKQRYSGVVFVHATAPLHVSGSGVKQWIRDALGRGDVSRPANLKRAEFNDLLRKRYKDEPIFDIAAVESTESGGGRRSFTMGGRTAYSLAPEYSSDGGHLNAAGSAVAARELLRTLAAASRSHVSRSTTRTQ
jgi:hypothetical protein